MASEELIEHVADEIAEVAEVTRTFTGRNFGFLFVGIGIGVAGGFAAGYFIAEHRLKDKYSTLANDEIGKIRDHYYAKKIADEKKPPPEVVVQERFTKAEQEAIDEVEEALEEMVAETPQMTPVDGWDYAFEIKNRNKEDPYIIHVDEFRENDVAHDQLTYTYYEADDVMVNSRDMKIEDMDADIGLGNLGRWGHGSKDPNLIYIRNERLELDFEIIRDRGSYEDSVNRTIRHSSDRHRRTKRKFDDE